MRKIFPASLMLENRRCVLVGAGNVALHKCERLLAAGARLHVVAPHAVPEFRTLAAAGKITLHKRKFDAARDLDAAVPDATDTAAVPAQNSDGTDRNSDGTDRVFLVVAATGNAALNEKIVAAAQARKILCSAVDAGWRRGDFIWPAVVARDGVTFTVASGGDHRKTRVFAEILRGAIDRIFAVARARFPEILKNSVARAEKTASVPAENSASAGAEKSASAGAHDSAACCAGTHGIFPIVIAGAGVGAGNVTLAVAEALKNCDVCLHDALIPPDILAFVPATAHKIGVGKRCGKHSAAQSEISAKAVAFARRGFRVVRLKGGDPTIFARLREELDAYRAAGISWKILPGISAFQAAAAEFSMPLTTRGRARSVSLATGRAASSEIPDEISRVAPLQNASGTPPATGTPRNAAGTIIYMGIREFPKIAARMMADGAAGTTPVRAVFGLGSARAFSVAGTLATLRLPETDLPGILFVGIESVPVPEIAREAVSEAVSASATA